MDVETFLRTVVTTDEGFFVMPVSDGNQWIETWHRWPYEIDDIVNASIKLRDQYNIHFSAYLFREATSDKRNALGTRTIQADLDDADVDALPIQPTVLVRTSPGRYHGYWVLDQELPLKEHEHLSRKLTYAIPKCDRSGWPIAKKLRITDTYNHKYDEQYHIEVVRTNDAIIPISSFDLLQPPPNGKEVTDVEDWLDVSEHTFHVGPNELLASIKSKIPATVYNQYNVVQANRSEALWALMCSAFRAGLSREAVFHLAKNSANNKFAHLRYAQDRELAKDVVRAEQTVKQGLTNLREVVNTVRSTDGTRHEKLQYLQEVVIGSLKEAGSFRHSNDGRLWYIDDDSGRPISLAQGSDQLSSMLDMRYALNPTEQEQRYVVHGITNYAARLPDDSIATNLSYYNERLNTLYIHAGKKDIYRIKNGSMDNVANGTDGIIFPWSNAQELFTPDYAPLPNPWYEELFRESVQNVTSLNQEQALCLYRTWLLFLLLRHAAISRPILAVFGQPGSGKSTLFRKIYALLYGGNRSIGAVTNADNYDHAVANDPLVVLDNVDTFERWLPDRLAQSTSMVDIPKRKLYSDTDIVILRRQALIGITAHAPKFGREDVSDRLLLITLERLKKFGAEGSIIKKVLINRNQLWGGILQDCMAVLKHPMPSDRLIPQFRVEDFARLGYWIAEALGFEKVFADTLNTIKTSQHAFNMDEDFLVVNAVLTYVGKSQKTADYHSPGQLWSWFESYSGDPVSFKKKYVNSQTLSNKLLTLQDSLKELVSVDWKIDNTKGTRMWRIGKKEDGST